MSYGLLSLQIAASVNILKRLAQKIWQRQAKSDRPAVHHYWEMKDERRRIERESCLHNLTVLAASHIGTQSSECAGQSLNQTKREARSRLDMLQAWLNSLFQQHHCLTNS